MKEDGDELLIKGWLGGGYRQLISDDISHVQLDEEPHHIGQAAIAEPLGYFPGDDELDIVIGTSGLHTRESSLIRVRLTKAEIANLARIAFGKGTFDEVIEAFAIARVRPPLANRRN